MKTKLILIVTLNLFNIPLTSWEQILIFSTFFFLSKPTSFPATNNDSTFLLEVIVLAE